MALSFKVQEHTIAEVADLPAGRQDWQENIQKLLIGEMYYTYAIKSSDKSYIYVGLTNNPERRISEHNNRKERTTRSYAPFKTILIEKNNTRIDARKREKYLKSGTGKAYFKTL